MKAEAQNHKATKAQLKDFNHDGKVFYRHHAKDAKGTERIMNLGILTADGRR